MKRRHLLQAAGATLAVPQLALAQSYPAKAMRYIVPVAAGGGSDMIARVVTERWGKALGQGFVVDNQSGGGGVVACQLTARAPADGYTLLQGYVATHGTTPATRRVNYDAVTDFTPIGMIGATPNVLAINANVPARDIKEFIDYVKRQPGKLSYGSAGQGSLTHLTMELLKQETGMFLLHIPYRGIAPAINDLLGGQVSMNFDAMTSVTGYIKEGKMQPLAVTTRERNAQLPDVPTMQELGVKDFDVSIWYTLMGPAGLPKATTALLNDKLNEVLRKPELRDRLLSLGVTSKAMSPEQVTEMLRTDIARYATVVKQNHIRMD